MATPFSVELSPAQVQELEQVRDHHPKAYVRVKAAGILKVWSGASRRHVAQHGLLKPVRRETVQRWIVCYQHEGVAGLTSQARTRAQARFFPLCIRRPGRRPRSARGSASQPTPLWAPT